MNYLRAPGGLEALELLHIAPIEGIEGVYEPLLVRAP